MVLYLRLIFPFWTFIYLFSIITLFYHDDFAFSRFTFGKVTRVHVYAKLTESEQRQYWLVNSHTVIVLPLRHIWYVTKMCRHMSRHTLIPAHFGLCGWSRNPTLGPLTGCKGRAPAWRRSPRKLSRFRHFNSMYPTGGGQPPPLHFCDNSTACI